MIDRQSMLAAGLLLGSLAVPGEAKTLIHAGRLFDGRGDSLRTAVTVTVDGDRITNVQDGYAAGGPGDTVVDLRNGTLLPGFIDLHVHISSQQSGAAGYAERFFLNPADVALRATTYARKTLLAGFTTVRDCGAGDKLNLALRDAVEKGWIAGPRIVAAGQRQHDRRPRRSDERPGLGAAGDPGRPPPGVANGADGVRAMVRQRYKDGADFIKIAATGGVLSLAKSGQAPLFTEEELRAVVETAREYGMKVAAHAHGSEGMLRAVRAGVHTIEHGTFMTEEIMAAMKERGTYYVPTISAGRFVAEKSKVDGYFPAVVRPKAASIGPQIQETFSKALKAGVKMAFGTDQGVAPHGDNALEFVYMVEGGMPPHTRPARRDSRGRARRRPGRGARNGRSRQAGRPRRGSWRPARRHSRHHPGELRDEGRRHPQATLACAPRRRSGSGPRAGLRPSRCQSFRKKGRRFEKSIGIDLRISPSSSGVISVSPRERANVLDALHHDAAHEGRDLRHPLARFLRPREPSGGRAAVGHALARDERQVARRLVDAARVLRQVVAGRGERARATAAADHAVLAAAAAAPELARPQVGEHRRARPDLAEGVLAQVAGLGRHVRARRQLAVGRDPAVVDPARAARAVAEHRRVRRRPGARGA